jgi:hypothetical protein
MRRYHDKVAEICEIKNICEIGEISVKNKISVRSVGIMSQGVTCKDFEDMLQYQCAVAGGCDVIITNNKKDFLAYSRLPLFTAEEYLNELR